MVSGANFYGSYLIAKNAAVFIIFSISAIFFYLLAKKISKSFNFALISTIIYIFYPYLFGHAQINPKDVPFLSVWLINSYLFLVFIENIINDNKIKIVNVIILSFFSAYLISIRISGIIIFILYLIALLIALSLIHI